MASEKNPFQKIRSQLDRKKIFESFIESEKDLICKGDGETLLTISGLRFLHEIQIMGQVKFEEGRVSGSLEMIGNFQAGEDKYFFMTKAEVVGHAISFPVYCEIYRLQRRGHQRLNIFGKKEISFRVTEYNQYPVLIHGTVVDFSVGGVRALFLEDQSAEWKEKSAELRVGGLLKGRITFSENKTLDVEAIIRHQTRKSEPTKSFLGEFGLEFLNLSPSQKNRLQMVTLDLQKKYLFHPG